MFLLPVLSLGAFLVMGLTIIGVGFILALLFYLMYHTFHGDLPKFMQKIVIAFFIIGIILAIIGRLF
jgi:hypothetical protein